MLMTVGVLGFVLPGVVGTPAAIAGGLVLWPKAFGKVENWFERRFPKVHKQSLYQINRYLNDLESRYPDATHRGADPVRVARGFACRPRRITRLTRSARHAQPGHGGRAAPRRTPVPGRDQAQPVRREHGSASRSATRGTACAGKHVPAQHRG